MISPVFIPDHTENLTNENPLHKIVNILLAVLQLGSIAGSVGNFIICHFVALCAIHSAQHAHSAQPSPFLSIRPLYHVSIVWYQNVSVLWY